MSKKASTNEQFSQPKSSNQKPADHVSLKGLLKPLFKKNHIRINGKKTTPENISQTDLFQGLAEKYPTLDNSQQQLASFFTTHLPKQKGFKYINLTHEPLRDKKGLRMDAYDAADKTISLAPLPQEEEYIPNPLLTLIHEGTHALDDLHMKTYQKSAPNFLAKHLKDTPLNKDKAAWYNGAQKLLAIPDFTNAYPYKGTARKNIVDSMFNLRESSEKPKIKDYAAAKVRLDELRDTGELDDDLFFASLSEFPAFFVENLSKPIDVNWETVSDKKSKGTKRKMESPEDNLGRKFLKTIGKDVLKNFHEIQPEFKTKYPEANKNFLRRLADLRNKNKHPTRKEYKKYLTDYMAMEE